MNDQHDSQLWTVIYELQLMKLIQLMVHMKMEHEVMDTIISGEITTDLLSDVYLHNGEAVMILLLRIQLV